MQVYSQQLFFTDIFQHRLRPPMLPSSIDSSPPPPPIPLHQISKSPTHVLNTCQKPCGLIPPALTEPIWIIQQLWNRKIDWDKLLPSDLTKLADIHNITLDRWYRSIDTDTELHVFADASKIAYSIACYIRFKVNNQPNSFVMSKSTCKINLHYKLPWLHHV